MLKLSQYETPQLVEVFFQREVEKTLEALMEWASA